MCWLYTRIGRVCARPLVRKHRLISGALIRSNVYLIWIPVYRRDFSFRLPQSYAGYLTPTSALHKKTSSRISGETDYGQCSRPRVCKNLRFEEMIDDQNVFSSITCRKFSGEHIVSARIVSAHRTTTFENSNGPLRIASCLVHRFIARGLPRSNHGSECGHERSIDGREQMIQDSRGVTRQTPRGSAIRVDEPTRKDHKNENTGNHALLVWFGIFSGLPNYALMHDGKLCGTAFFHKQLTWLFASWRCYQRKKYVRRCS